MAIEVRIPTILRTYTGGEKAVEGAGDTLAELIDDLETPPPGLKDRLVDGRRRRCAASSTSTSTTRTSASSAASSTALTDGDSVDVLPAVAGG